MIIIVRSGFIGNILRYLGIRRWNTGNIFCMSIPSGATIYLDGVFAGVTPFEIEALTPGTYELRASLNGYDSNTTQMTVSAGKTNIYSRTLKKNSTYSVQPYFEAEQTQSHVGTVSAKVIPIGSIFFDDIWVGISPVTISKIKPGTHTIEANWNGYYPDIQQITISAGQTLVYSPSLRKLPTESPKLSTNPPESEPQPRSQELPQLRNPLLLGVKMFLADVIYLVNMPYDWDRHNCSNFSKDVQNAASKLGIRCGYVEINFKNSKIGHAIVAFETDFGLKFFEPQSAEEEDVIVGHKYSVALEGIPDHDIISKVKICWNDGTNTTME